MAIALATGVLYVHPDFRIVHQAYTGETHMLDLGKLSAATQIVKDIHTMLIKLESVKQNAELCDKLEEILNLRMTLIDAKEEIVDLRAQLSEVKKRQDNEGRLKFDERRGVYFLEDHPDGHAYCPKCWSEHSRLVPMTKGVVGYGCSSCGSVYRDPDYKTPKINRVASTNPFTRGRW